MVIDKRGNMYHNKSEYLNAIAGVFYLVHWSRWLHCDDEKPCQWKLLFWIENVPTCLYRTWAPFLCIQYGRMYKLSVSQTWDPRYAINVTPSLIAHGLVNMRYINASCNKKITFSMIMLRTLRWTFHRDQENPSTKTHIPLAQSLQSCLLYQ